MICQTCRGYGYARGGVCWNCGGSGSEHPARFLGHLVTHKDGSPATFFPAGEAVTLSQSGECMPVYAEATTASAVGMSEANAPNLPTRET